MKRVLGAVAVTVLLLTFTNLARSQSLGNAGTIEGSVLDPSGAAIVKAEVTIHNTITGYRQSTVSGADGSFRLVNIPPNPYHLQINVSGFAAFSQDVDIRNAIPVQVKATPTVAGATTSANVVP